MMLKDLRMKRSWLAFVLSFVIPGAGLWYLGRPGWGACNLGAFLLLALVLPGDVIDNYFHYFYVACGAGSGGLAHALATD